MKHNMSIVIFFLYIISTSLSIATPHSKIVKMLIHDFCCPITPTQKKPISTLTGHLIPDTNLQTFAQKHNFIFHYENFPYRHSCYKETVLDPEFCSSYPHFAGPYTEKKYSYMSLSWVEKLTSVLIKHKN